MTDATDAQATLARETLHERIAYRGFATVAWLGKVVPTTTGRVLFRWLGIAAFHLLPNLRAVVAANQSHVVGRPVEDPLVRAATREAFVRYARYWFDAFDVATWTDERVASACSFEGLEHIREALADGTGVLAAVPHMGNWDAIGRALAIEGLPVISVAERLRPDRLFRLFLDHRRGLGMEIIGLDEDVGRRLADMLAANRFVALVADRDLSGKGVEVEMFGATRRLPAGPALLALRTGAPLVTAALYQTSTGWRAVVHEPIAFEPTGDRRADVTELTERIARAFERDISAAPADWHLFQPGWGP